MKASNAALAEEFITGYSWRETSPELQWIEADRFSVIRKARQKAIGSGQRLIDLSMINPDCPPPRFCLDKLSEFLLQPENHRYSVARGIRKLRQAFADKYQHKFGVRLSADENVCVCAGTKDALMHVLRVAAQPSEKILIPAPTYPLYHSALNLNSLSACYYGLDTDEDQILANILEAISRYNPKVLLLNFPNNPTGMTVSRAFYEKLLPIVKQNDILVINDFVYGELAFNRTETLSLLSVEEFMDHAVEIYSMSKAYNVPGWRIGAVLGNKAIVKRISDLKSHTDYGSFLPLQHAAAAALSVTTDLVSPQIQLYQKRCQVLQDCLSRLGFKVSMPQAGCCIWAELPDGFAEEGGASFFALECLQKLNLLITPGEIFGSQFSRHIRIATVIPEDDLATLLDKFAGLMAH